MSRRRLHLPPSRFVPAPVLEPEERHYLLDVLRLCDGDEIEVFDGAGRSAKARLRLHGEAWGLSLGEIETQTAPQARVRLGVALLKGRKLDEVVRMATEIGVHSFETFTCARSLPRPQRSAEDHRQNRWREIAAAAARQCGRSFLPRVEPVRAFPEMLADPGPVKILLHPAAQESLGAVLARGAASEVLLLVGPEGGFAPEEIELAVKRQVGFAWIGIHVLRADTAAVAAATLSCLDMAGRGRVRV
jgi:16S rRNA (uracil1498-N3)-methyltransferase